MVALKDYQRYAVRCLQEARIAADSGHKVFLVEMAHAWQKLADQELNWPAPGSEDTELGVLMEPEVGHGAAEVYTRVQA
jgi:hypothetical protein